MKKRHYILIAILLIGLGVRTIRLSWPAAPVFDEAHFATYAADYLKGQVFFDIHPPLGKLIYASALFVATGGRQMGDTNFIDFIQGKTIPAGIPFNSFPYVPLRAVSVVFGVLLIAAFYGFLRSVGVSEAGSLLGALFVALDNALILQTKLILLDGMYLAFGFAALALYFRRPRWPVAAGVMFALSLGVKLMGIIFLAPLLIDYFLEPTERVAGAKRLKQFAAAAALVFAAIAFFNFLFFSPASIINLARTSGVPYPAMMSPPAEFFFASLANTLAAWSGYLVGGFGLYGSPWYLWPFMQIPIYYYYPYIALLGNPALWFASTGAVICGFVALPRYIKKRSSNEAKTFFILIGGYVAGLIPFFTIVQRTTFLYHYFPALLFAFGLLAWIFSRWLKLDDIDSLSRRQWFFIGAITIAVLCGFLATAPLTYGV